MIKYLLIITLLAGCATTKNLEDQYGEDEIGRSGDTVFFRGTEKGFLLTQQESSEWVVMQMVRTYTRYSLWKKVDCDSLPKVSGYGVTGSGVIFCSGYESKITSERYNLRGVEMQYVLQPEYGEKFVREIN